MTSVADQDWFKAPGLTRVLDLLNHDGEARVVGGAVRNSLTGLPVSDMDIATTLLPEAVQARAYDFVPYVPTAQFILPTAYRTNLSGLIIAPITLMWNVEKK